MSSNFIFDLAPTSNFNLSFLMDIGNTHWYSNGEKQKKDFLCKQLKQELPKNSIFNISSLVFNFKTKEQEVLSSYSCFFQPINESLCIILEANANHANFTRECMMNFMDFAEKTGIKMIYLLLSQKNKNYVDLLMDLRTFGFEREPNISTASLGGNTYKVLKMNIQELPEEIEEIDLIC